MARVARLGPRLRISSTRIRSSSSMGANSPLGSQPSARLSSVQQFTRTGKQQRRSIRRNCLQPVDQSGAAELGHHQVGQHQIDTAELHHFNCTFGIGTGEDAITARLEHNFSNGERAFVVINAENRTFRFHLPPLGLLGSAAQLRPSKPVSQARAAVTKWAFLIHARAVACLRIVRPTRVAHKYCEDQLRRKFSASGKK